MFNHAGPWCSSKNVFTTGRKSVSVSVRATPAAENACAPAAANNDPLANVGPIRPRHHKHTHTTPFFEMLGNFSFWRFIFKEQPSAPPAWEPDPPRVRSASPENPSALLLTVYKIPDDDLALLGACGRRSPACPGLPKIGRIQESRFPTISGRWATNRSVRPLCSEIFLRRPRRYISPNPGPGPPARPRPTADPPLHRESGRSRPSCSTSSSPGRPSGSSCPWPVSYDNRQCGSSASPRVLQGQRHDTLRRVALRQIDLFGAADQGVGRPHPASDPDPPRRVRANRVIADHLPAPASFLHPRRKSSRRCAARRTRAAATCSSAYGGAPCAMAELPLRCQGSA